MSKNWTKWILELLYWFKCYGNVMQGGRKWVDFCLVVELAWGGSVTNGAYLVIHSYRLVSSRHQAVGQGHPEGVSYPGVNYQQ